VGLDEKSGQITKIEGLLGDAIRIDPTNARAYTVRGLVYIITKRTREAAEAAQNAVRLNPSYALWIGSTSRSFTTYGRMDPPSAWDHPNMPWNDL
jgi:cytochrome c-type biogenesis protein CcmH/NrfG